MVEQKRRLSKLLCSLCLLTRQKSPLQQSSRQMLWQCLRTTPVLYAPTALAASTYLHALRLPQTKVLMMITRGQYLILSIIVCTVMSLCVCSVQQRTAIESHTYSSFFTPQCSASRLFAKIPQTVTTMQLDPPRTLGTGKLKSMRCLDATSTA